MRESHITFNDSSEIIHQHGRHLREVRLDLKINWKKKYY